MISRRFVPVRAVLGTALLSVLASLSPAPASAQSEISEWLPEARLQGVVVDAETYQPVVAATVSLQGLDQSMETGRWGSFAFPDAPLGTVSVVVTAAGHPTVVQEVEVTGERVVYMQVVLPSVAAILSELVVNGAPARVRPRDETALTAADLLANEVPRTRANPGDIGTNDFRISLREATTISGDVNPMILIDGVVMSRSRDAYATLMSIPAADVLDIEVLKGPAAASLYPFAANGVIRIRTKRGGGR